jgi:hypothetical protein
LPSALRLFCHRFFIASFPSIDYEEYPHSAEIQNRCVNMIARLFHIPTDASGENAIERFGHYLFDLVFHVGGDETSEVELGITVQTQLILPLRRDPEPMREYDC